MTNTQFDILDTAWLQIIRLHPDIELNSLGGPLELKRNYKIDHPMKIDAKKEIEHCVTNFVECDGYLFVTNQRGNLRITPASNDSTITEEDLTESQIDEEGNGWSSLSHLTIDSVRNIQSRYDDTEVCMRVVLYHLVALKQAPTTVDPKKKAEPPETRNCYRVLLADLVLLKNKSSTEPEDDTEDNEAAPSFTFSIVHELMVDKFTDDQIGAFIQSPGDALSIDMSFDGSFCSVVSRGSEGGCKIYQLGSVNILPKPVVKVKPPPSEEEGEGEGEAAQPSAEEKEEEEEEEEEVIPWGVVSDPIVLALLEHKSSVINDLSIDSIVLLALPEQKPVEQPAAPATPAAPLVAVEGGHAPGVGHVEEEKENPLPILEGFTFICIPANPSKCWFTLGLQRIIEEPVVVDEKAAKKGKAAEVVEPADPLLYSVFQKAATTLCSQITCCKFDSLRNILVIGQYDGSVNLFNLSDLSLVTTVANHKRPITSLWIHCQQEKGIFYLVSGSTNGTLCFYSCVHDTSEFEVHFEKSLFSMKVIDYRFDIADSYVVQIQGPSKPNPLFPYVFVQYSTGHMAVYDYTKASLTGSLCSTVRDNFDIMQLKPVTYENLGSTVPAGEMVEVSPGPPSPTPVPLMSDVDILASLHLKKSISIALDRTFSCLFLRPNNTLLQCEYISTSNQSNPMTLMGQGSAMSMTSKSKISIHSTPLDPIHLLKKHSTKSKNERSLRKAKLAKSMQEFSNLL